MQQELREHRLRQEQHSRAPALPAPEPTEDAEGFDLTSGYNMHGLDRQGNHFYKGGAGAAGPKGEMVLNVVQLSSAEAWASRVIRFSS